VGDEEQGAVESTQGVDERVDRLEVEVVGGLVKHQDVGLTERQAGEHQAGGLPAERPESFFSTSSPENRTRPSWLRTKRRSRPAGVPQPALHCPRALVLEPLVVSWRSTPGGSRNPDDRAAIGRQLTHDDLEQGRLADAVGPMTASRSPEPGGG